MTAYAQRRHLQYSASQLFDLVADVERYPEFLPWVLESRIRWRKDQTIFVDMTIGLGPLRKQFSSVGLLTRPQRINITSSDSIFDHFEQRWTFGPTADASTDVEYHVDYQFRSRMLQALMGASFAERATQTMTAFKRRAQQLYGSQV
jgi:coenzyme Q-binding protein COQ10